MPNARDAKADTNLILAVGEPGGGKTAGFLTLPGKKFLYIFDPNTLATIQGHDVDYEEFLPDDVNLNIISLRNVGEGKSKKPLQDSIVPVKEPQTYNRWLTDFHDRAKAGGFEGYDVVGFDSLTGFQEAVMDRELYLNKRPGKWPEQDDWTAALSTVMNATRVVTAMRGGILYVTCHTELKQDEQTKKIQNVLFLIGRLRVLVPSKFAQVWRFYADINNENQKHFYIQTVQDRQNPYIRSSIQGLKPHEEVTIKNWQNPAGEGIGRFFAKPPTEGKVVPLTKEKS